MIDTFSRYFDQQVRDAIGVRGINLIQGLLNLLNSLDNQIVLNASSESTRRMDFNNVSILRRNLPPPRSVNNSSPSNSDMSSSFCASTPINSNRNFNRSQGGGNNNSARSSNYNTSSRFSNNTPQVNDISISEILDVEELDGRDEKPGATNQGN